MAVYVMLCVSACLRPGEGVRLRNGGVVAPVLGVMPSWCLLLHAEKFRVRSKTGASDGSAPVDSVYMGWAPPIFELLTSGCRSSPLWNFDYRSFCLTLRKAIDYLGLNDVVPYQMRLSGPSIGRARQLRPFAEVKKRRRWTSVRSVLRYEKAARLAFTSRDDSGEQRRVVAYCEARLGDTLLGTARASPESRSKGLLRRRLVQRRGRCRLRGPNRRFLRLACEVPQLRQYLLVLALRWQRRVHGDVLSCIKEVSRGDMCPEASRNMANKTSCDFAGVASRLYECLTSRTHCIIQL